MELRLVWHRFALPDGDSEVHGRTVYDRDATALNKTKPGRRRSPLGLRGVKLASTLVAVGALFAPSRHAKLSWRRARSDGKENKVPQVDATSKLKLDRLIVGPCSSLSP